MRFAKEHPSEILIFQIRVTDIQKAKDEFAEGMPALDRIITKKLPRLY